MNSRKRNKLKAKRTPCIKSRYSRKARAVQGVMRAMVLRQGLFGVNVIINSFAPNASAKVNKTIAMANAVINTISAASKVPLYGSKTV